MTLVPVSGPAPPLPAVASSHPEAAAFFEAFEAAARAVGHGDHWFDLAGRKLLLRVAGPALNKLLTPALAHLACPPARAPALEIRAWDSQSSGVALPGGIGHLATHVEGAAPAAASRDGLFSAYSFPALNLFDSARRLAGFWVQDGAALPYYEWAGPMRNIIHWWAGTQGLQLVHAAAVGVAGEGVLIVGKSGSGKSTTSLGALLGGLEFLGDDRCLVDLASNAPVAHGVYASAKLHGPNLDRFPELRPLIENPGFRAEDKAVVMVGRHFAGQVVRELHVNAILAPNVTHSGRTTFERISAADGLKALAPSTVFHLPSAGVAPFQAMAQLARRVPSYRVNLGADSLEVTAALRSFIQNLPVTQA